MVAFFSVWRCLHGRYLILQIFEFRTPECFGFGGEVCSTCSNQIAGITPIARMVLSSAVATSYLPEATIVENNWFLVSTASFPVICGHKVVTACE